MPSPKPPAPPAWSGPLPPVEAVLAATDALFRCRWQAGWSRGAEGWLAPDGTPEHAWAANGYPFPEDPDYAAWASAFWHPEALDADQLPALEATVTAARSAQQRLEHPAGLEG
jgi:hypothetical protein